MKKIFTIILFMLIPFYAQASVNKLGVLQLGHALVCKRLQQEILPVVLKILRQRDVQFDIIDIEPQIYYDNYLKEARKRKLPYLLLLSCQSTEVSKFKYQTLFIPVLLKILGKNSKSFKTDSLKLYHVKKFKGVKNYVIKIVKRYLSLVWEKRKLSFVRGFVLCGNLITTDFNLGLIFMGVYDLRYKSRRRLAFGITAGIDFAQRYRVSLSALGGYPITSASLNLFFSLSGAYALLFKQWNVFSLWISPIGYENRLFFFSKSTDFRGHEHRFPVGIDLELNLLRIFGVRAYDLKLVLGARYSLGFAVSNTNTPATFLWRDVSFHSRLLWTF
ncbi:hypothetical protein KKH43_04455 [Patescibacteria group bacterium]|nr:hypothetical protein [Patescibacteria group bacterium]